MRFVIGWAALFLAIPLCAQVQDESQAPVRTYNLLRENDDWSFLADPYCDRIRSQFSDRRCMKIFRHPGRQSGCHPRCTHRVGDDVGLPTGKWSDSRPVNLGNHFVVVDPDYAFTYERKKVEFIARLHYLWNSVNNDPFVGFGIKDMQPGQAFHINYATSYELFKNVRPGFNGYWLQQLTDHDIDGVAVPNSKERTLGLGPGIQLGGQGIWFRVNSYMETDVRNRPNGIKVTLRISKTLPAKEPNRLNVKGGPGS